MGAGASAGNLPDRISASDRRSDSRDSQRPPSRGRIPSSKHLALNTKSKADDKPRRRESVFEESGAEQGGDAKEGSNYEDGMDRNTKSILMQAIEQFLMIDGTDLRDDVVDMVLKSMVPVDFAKGSAIITQGDTGNNVYVVESGHLQVIVNGEKIRVLQSGALFGELALLFDARRSATVISLNDCKLWSLDRAAFKMIQRNAANLSLMQRTRRFLVVPELAALPSTELARLMATLTPMSYRSGDSLYAAGKVSTKIMLIEEGTVMIVVPPALQHLPQDEIERVIGIYRPISSELPGSAPEARNNDEDEEGSRNMSFNITEGCIIGMGILHGKIGSPRGWIWVDAKVDGKPYVGAMPPITAVAVGKVKTAFFTVYRFERTFGPAEDFYESYYAAAEERDEFALAETDEPIEPVSDINFNVDYFDEILTLFAINMGTVGLAYKQEIDTDTGQSYNKQYILKILNKAAVIEQKMANRVMDEARLLSCLRSPFISLMFGKFQTPDELIFVLERVPGGDLWHFIHERNEIRDQFGFMPLPTVRFYTASIMLALEHMHSKAIAFRNLKPENILIDINGYIKLVGLGFAKKVPFITSQGILRAKTFTFCGTLEYLPPEVVLNNGHDQRVDLWALGVLIYEMIAAITPFGLATYSQTDGDRGEDTLSQSQPSDGLRRDSVNGSEVVQEADQVSPRDDYYNNNNEGKEEKEERLQRLKATTEKISTSELVDETSKLLATIASTRTHGVQLPHDFSDLTSGAEVTSLLLGLLNPEPAERLALQRRISVNAFQHEFFVEFDWNALAESKLDAPYVPTNISDTTDSKNIPLGDCYLGDQSMFEGF